MPITKEYVFIWLFFWAEGGTRLFFRGRKYFTRTILKVTTLILCMVWMWSKQCKINVSYSRGLWDSTVQVSLHFDQYNANSAASEMENIGDTLSKSDVCAIIQFLYSEGVPANNTIFPPKRFGAALTMDFQIFSPLQLTRMNWRKNRQGNEEYEKGVETLRGTLLENFPVRSRGLDIRFLSSCQRFLLRFSKLEIVKFIKFLQNKIKIRTKFDHSF